MFSLRMFWPFSSTPTITKNKPTSFLDLPAELRNEIYRLAIPSGAVITHDETFSTSPTYSMNSTRNGLVDLGGQIGDEATTFFYSDNIFEFTSFSTTFAFLITLGEVRRALIRDLRLSYDQRAERAPLHSHLHAVAAFAGACRGHGLKGLNRENLFVDIRWMRQRAETYCRLTEFHKILMAAAESEGVCGVAHWLRKRLDPSGIRGWVEQATRGELDVWQFLVD